MSSCTRKTLRLCSEALSGGAAPQTPRPGNKSPGAPLDRSRGGALPPRGNGMKGSQGACSLGGVQGRGPWQGSGRSPEVLSGLVGPRRRGFVLISVLMLGVLLISCASAFAWFVRLQVRSALRERVALTNRSMAQVLTASVIGAVSKLSKETDADSPLQEWYKPFLLPADNMGLWAVRVLPLDDKIPVRSLFLPDKNTVRGEMKRPWEDLWQRMGRRELAVLTLDFMDANDKARVGGAERGSFINRPPLDISEFLLLEEVTPELLDGVPGRPGLADFCTVWSGGKVNLNVAPQRVLELLPGLDASLADRVTEYRRRNIIRSLNDLQKIPGLSPKVSTMLTNVAGCKSRYFSLHIEFLEESAGGTAFDIVFDRSDERIVRWEEL